MRETKAIFVCNGKDVEAVTEGEWVISWRWSYVNKTCGCIACIRVLPEPSWHLEYCHAHSGYKPWMHIKCCSVVVRGVEGNSAWFKS